MSSKDTKETLTVKEILERQRLLEEEAGEILSGKFDECTFNKGYIRQPVYACKTCKPNEGCGPGGVCYSCSISCHADHELVELFSKRNFKCDCGTARLETACKLEAKPSNTFNERNKYDHNYEGRFCWCKVDYDPEKEDNNMLQCVICEDWFHENCISGEKQGEKRFSLPDLETFEEFLCHKCLDKHYFLKPYLNSHTFFSGQYHKNQRVDGVNVTSNEKANDFKSGDKMSLSITTNTSNNKNKAEESFSTALSSSSTSSVNNKRKIEEDDKVSGEENIDVVTALPKKLKNEHVNTCKRERWAVSDEVEVDLFCVQGWRDELCRCVKCMELYKQHQIEFILGEEETYEPPEDDDAQKSLFDCGMKALNQMDRVTAIEGILAYNQFRDELIEFLKPFGESGKTVTVKDVNEFFEAKLRDRKPATGPFPQNRI